MTKGRPRNKEMADYIVSLRDVKKFSFRQIAKTTGKNIKTVHGIYTRAKALA